SGDEALKILCNSHIDMIISDYQMPRMNGIELLRIVRKKYPSILRFILTGQADLKATIQAINEIQVYQFLTKPWNNQDLKLIIYKAKEYLDLLNKNKKMEDLIRNQNLKLKDLNHNLSMKVKEKTRELHEANLKLEKLNKMKDDFITLISHEFNTPLTIINGFTSLLENNQQIDKNNLQIFINKIRNGVNRLGEMINDMILLNKLQGGFNFNTNEQVDLKKIIDNCLSILNPTIIKKVIKINFASSNTENYYLNKNELLINKCIFNIIQNAVIHSPNNSKIEIKLIKAEGYISILVANTGIDIDNDLLPGIFDKFTHGQHISMHKKGLGLGLPISKLIVDKYNGNIELSKEKEELIQVKIDFPLNNHKSE
ncbi:MAG: hybrid sensor histidine kinase/response regulator, partial [Spirochaetes bacterium]|nr:hybrid sensor histidine kinase/response regulator [Spirochaetota bacterium]